jgi:hypothetical protein
MAFMSSTKKCISALEMQLQLGQKEVWNDLEIDAQKT